MNLYKEIEKAFILFEELISKENAEEFKNAKISDLSLYHFGIGTWIRNTLLYPKESILYNLFLENGISEADEMSSITIRIFHYILNSRTPNI